jgi:hypothetical protein
MADLDPFSLAVIGPQQLVSSKLNKVNLGAGALQEGPEGERLDEFKLSIPDEDLIRLGQERESLYRTYEAGIKPRQDANKTYYLGKQKQQDVTGVEDAPAIAGNGIFEAEETFLPAALSKNPEPVVWSDNTKEGTALANDVKTMLQYHADVLVLRRKLALVVRHWSVYFLGAVKHGWNEKITDISLEVVKPRMLMLDPDGAIDPYGDFSGEWLGERKSCSATRLAEMFPKEKAYITVSVDGKMGTKVMYTEWWTNEYCYYTYRDVVLDKHKNPHFVYGSDLPNANHFAQPKMPYTFLSVFSFGEQPHDVTGLIEQNIPNQNLITRRISQIDTNLNRSNNSIGLSGANFNQQTGKQAAKALKDGDPVLIPSGGPVSEAIARFPAPAVPDAFFKDLQANQQNLKSIFGTEGISSSQPNEDTTARGMILNQQFDNSRIGGGIGDALEQFADNIFNWWVQLYHVYYDEPHFATIIGQLKSVEYTTLSNANLDRRLVISVTPDSMKPKDEITEMNQAMSLFEAGALDPKTLLTMLNVPDAQEVAESTVLWLLDKQTYMALNFPEIQEKLMEAQAQGQLGPTGAAPQPSPGAGPGPVPTGGASVPESPPQAPSAVPASASLSQVPLPTA